MKNLLRISLIALLVSAMSACNVEEETAVDGTVNDSLVFTASIGDFNKTTIENAGDVSKVCWASDDLIVINNVLYKANPDADNPRLAVFTKLDKNVEDPEPIDGKYIACYPPSAYDYAKSRVRISSVVAMNDNTNIDYVPMYAESEGTDLYFQNIFALFEFKLRGTSAVRKIKVTYNPYNETTKWFAGAFEMDQYFQLSIDLNYKEEGDNPQYGSSSSITLDCGNDGQLSEDGELFFLPIPPMEAVSLMFEITSTDGHVFTKTTSKKVQVMSGSLYAFDWTPDFSAEELVAVDLGLPSGVKWGSMNIGATHPYTKGSFFAWGETRTKNSYSNDNYRTDGQFEDVATSVLGGEWRIPDNDDFKELMDSDYCTWTPETIDGIDCVRVTSVVNGNSIVIPCCGFMQGTYNRETNYGFYPSSTPNLDKPSYPYMHPYILEVIGTSPLAHMYLSTFEGYPNPEITRPNGLQVRPVYGTPIPLPEGALFGKFTVNASGKQVRFSRGNLVATLDGSGHPKSWSFAENQYNSIGYNDANRTLYDGNLDLFGWSTESTAYGINVSKYNRDYSGTFYDWGNAVDGSWRTLTSAEWEYLLGRKRLDEKPLSARYVKVMGHEGCLVLYPDGYSGTIASDGNTTLYDTEEEWLAAQSKGVVCLPLTGYRVQYLVEDSAMWGYYWTSTGYAGDNVDEWKAIYLGFSKEGSLGLGPDNRYDGCAVRLVMDVE